MAVTASTFDIRLHIFPINNNTNTDDPKSCRNSKYADFIKFNITRPPTHTETHTLCPSILKIEHISVNKYCNSLRKWNVREKKANLIALFSASTRIHSSRSHIVRLHTILSIEQFSIFICPAPPFPIYEFYADINFEWDQLGLHKKKAAQRTCAQFNWFGIEYELSMSQSSL